MDVKKVIGNKVEEIYPEMVYSKLYAFREVIPSLLMEMGSKGSYNKKALDMITFGMDEIFRDILTEMDQVFFKGDMERSGEELEDKATELEDQVLAALRALRVEYPYPPHATPTCITHITYTYEALAKLFFLARDKANHPLPEWVKQKYLFLDSDSKETAGDEIKESIQSKKLAPDTNLHALIEQDLEFLDLYEGQDRLGYWMAEIDTEIEKLQELKRRCMEERSRRRKEKEAKTNETEKEIHEPGAATRCSNAVTAERAGA